VYKQPHTEEEMEEAREALAACPVAAIRVETKAEKRHASQDKEAVDKEWSQQDERIVQAMSLKDNYPFPKPIQGLHNVYWTGHHNEHSFGASPYLIKRKVGAKDIWVMVDTPRYSKKAAKEVRDLIEDDDGPNYLFLTHVDDTADHAKWKEEFPKLQRIFHSGDTGKYNWLRDDELNNVEILLPSTTMETTTNSGEIGRSLTAYDLDGDVLSSDWNERMSVSELPLVVLHTPGHSPGSITLYSRPDPEVMDDGRCGILFTGDTFAFSTRTMQASGFPRYGNDLKLQADVLRRFLNLDYSFVAPGHGHPISYLEDDDVQLKRRKQKQDVENAVDELVGSRRLTSKW
jgi:glyoxylase-like metal-dependent hydrolase (beta-lactamase superfamily II)